MLAVDSFTDEEKGRTLDYYRNTIDALEEEIFLLRTIFGEKVGRERREIETKIIILEGDLAKMKNHKEAFGRGTSPINPPSREQVAAIKQLSKKVDNINVDEATAEAILASVDEVLETLNALQQDLTPTAAG